MENNEINFRHFGKVEKATSQEVPSISLSPVISRAADIEANFQDVKRESFINKGELSDIAFQKVAARCQELGLTRSGNLHEVFSTIQQSEPMPGSSEKSVIREATLVFEYDHPQVSDKSLRLAVKFNHAKRDQFQVSEILLDSENKRIAASTRKEVEGWFYNRRQASAVDDKARSPRLAVYNSDSCEYEEVVVKNEADVIARLKVAGVELQNRNSGEGLDRPFVEICAYDTPTRTKVAEILRADKPLEEKPVVKQVEASKADPTEELAKVKTSLAALYNQATANLDTMEAALKNNDQEKAEKCREIQASLESEIKDVEDKQTRLAMNLQPVGGEPGTAAGSQLFTCKKCGNRATAPDMMADLEGKPFEDYYCKSCARDMQRGNPSEMIKNPPPPPENPMTVAKKKAQMVAVEEGVDVVDPLAETSEVEIPADLMRKDSEAAPVQATKAKKEGQSTVPPYVKTPDSPTPDRAVDPHMKPAEYEYIRQNYVEPLTREEMKVLLAKAGDPLEREDLPDVKLVELVLKDIFAKKIRLEDVMELPYRTGRKQKAVAAKKDEKKKDKDDDEKSKKDKKSAQLADAGQYKVGDRVLVRSLRRSGEVTDLKRVEQTDEIVYEVALHGVPEPKLFKSEALEKLSESEAESVESGEVQNFPGTTKTPGESIVTPPAIPGSEITASSATSRARSFYRLGKKAIAEDKSTPVGKEPDKISREPQRKPGRGPTQAEGVAKYHEAYNPRNLGSGFYKPTKTAERIIDDVMHRLYPDFQTAFNAWTKDWDDHPAKEVIRALKWAKVDVELGKKV